MPALPNGLDRLVSLCLRPQGGVIIASIVAENKGGSDVGLGPIEACICRQKRRLGDMEEHNCKIPSLSVLKAKGMDLVVSLFLPFKTVAL